MSKEYSRGEFLGIGGALAAGFGLGGCVGTGERERRAASGGEAPDLVLLNGKIYTVDDAQPRAEAFAVKNGDFIAVGSNDDIRNLVTRNTEVIDAGGMTVTPGFIDCHCHPQGLSELYDVFLANVTTIGEGKRRLAGEGGGGEESGAVGGWGPLRRHQGHRRGQRPVPPDQPMGPGRGGAEPSGAGQPPGGPHRVVQLESAGNGRNHP